MSGDMGDAFREVKQHFRERNAKREPGFLATLQLWKEVGPVRPKQEADGRWRVSNTKGNRYADFWPGTGKWYAPRHQEGGYGTATLLRFLQEAP